MPSYYFNSTWRQLKYRRRYCCWNHHHWIRLVVVVMMFLVFCCFTSRTTKTFTSAFSHYHHRHHQFILLRFQHGQQGRISLQNRMTSTTTTTALNNNNNDDDDSSVDASSSSGSPPTTPPPTQKIAIVGGGLAGLSTAYHILDLLSILRPTTTKKPSFQQQQQPQKQQQQKQQQSYEITILDKEKGPGIGGASAVAGGLVHPLSPRGKLVHWGLEGLEVTNHLVDEASRATTAVTTTNNNNDTVVVLRKEIFRIATTDKQAKQLQKTAQELPQICQWMSSKELIDRLGIISIMEQQQQQAAETGAEDESTITSIKGGLRLYNGCKVLHLPSYLKGLWAACQMKTATKEDQNPPPISSSASSSTAAGTVSIRWKQQQDTVSSKASANKTASSSSLPLSIDDDCYDAVVWAAGSGLFDYGDDSNDDNKHSPGGGGAIKMKMKSSSLSSFPVQLVRGQSVEVQLSSSSSWSSDDYDRHHPTTTTPPKKKRRTEALLSGKYISPLPEPDRVLVGATHEFQREPMTRFEVKRLLQEKTELFAPHVWKNNNYNKNATNNSVSGRGGGSGSSASVVADRYTTGVRVQSQRGAKGRLPIVGRIYDDDDDDKEQKTTTTTKHWIFTGLSSRGLLYHGIYGKVLAQAILEGSEKCLKTKCPDYDWWRQPKK